jgi:transposase-like protein
MTSRPPWQAATEERAMDQRIRKPAAAHDPERTSLGELIHQHVRLAIDTAVHEELRAALGATPYERSDIRRGYRNGTKARTLTGPTGPVALPAGRRRRASDVLPLPQGAVEDAPHHKRD